MKAITRQQIDLALRADDTVDTVHREDILAACRANPSRKVEPLLSVAEFAKQKSVSTVTVRRWVHEGRLQVERLSPRTIRIRPDSLTEAPVPTAPTGRNRRGQFSRSDGS